MRSWGTAGMRIAHQTMGASKESPEVEEKIEQVEEKIEKSKEKDMVVACKECDFKAKNPSGLRLHMKKHEKIENEKEL